MPQPPALTDREAHVIRDRCRHGDLVTDLAHDYAVSRSTIYHVIHGTGAYSHLSPVRTRTKLSRAKLDRAQCAQARDMYRQGRKLREIAFHLEVSEKTIRNVLTCTDGYSHLRAKPITLPTHRCLSDAEAAAMAQLAQEGHSNAFIAGQFDVSVSTVSNAITRHNRVVEDDDPVVVLMRTEPDGRHDELVSAVEKLLADNASAEKIIELVARRLASTQETAETSLAG